MINDLAKAPCLAVDFGGSKVAIALFDEAGAIEKYERIVIDGDLTASAILEHTGQTCRSIIGDRDDTVVGVVSPGVVLPDRVLLAPNVAGWRDVALEDWARQILPGRQVAVGNDVKAAAAAEATWGALRGCNPGLYVNLGTGIAAAVVIDGRVVFGANGAAGEIGYNTPFNRNGVSENDAAAGHDVIVEDIVGARSIVKRAQALGLDCLDVSEVFGAIAKDPTVSLLIDEVIGEVAVQLRSIVHLIDPSRIVIGGGLSASAASFLPRLRERLNIKTGVAPEISVATFKTASSLHGARYLALTQPLEAVRSIGAPR